MEQPLGDPVGGRKSLLAIIAEGAATSPGRGGAAPLR